MMNRYFKMVCLIACLAVVFGLNQTTRATTAVFTAISAVGSTELRPAVEIINGDGLAFAVPATINSLADLPKHNEDPNTLADGDFHGGMWLTAATPTGSITFDLGSVKTVDTLIVWNYAEVSSANTTPLDSSTRGAHAVNLYADNSATPTTFIQSLSFSQAVISPLGGTNVSQTPFFNDDYNTTAVIYTLTTPITARYIKFDITSNWGDPSYLGLSEVRFGETLPVPEPASLSLLAGGLLLMLRRRR